MSSYYGIVFPEYWTGRTGRAIQKKGGKDAALLGLYLTTNRLANMIGLYRLTPDIIVHETPLKLGAIEKAFEVLAAEEFAEYDAASEHVWVREMARFRLNLRDDRPSLDKDDKRVVGVQRLYHGIDDNPFLQPFYEKYHRVLHLKKLRTSTRYPHPSPLGRGLVGSMKPGTGSGTRYQEQESGKSTAASRRSVDNRVEISEGTYGLYCVIATEARAISNRDDGDDSFSNVTHHFKALCAQRHIDYASNIADKAIEAVMREKAS